MTKQLLNWQTVKSIFKITISNRSIHNISNRFGIIGVPFDKGQTKKGVSDGPDAIRNGKLLDHLHSISSKYTFPIM